jgi:uncharacterized protein (TIGR00290 family)
MPQPKAIFNWSGGKDSALCLYKVLQQKLYNVTGLLTSISQEHQRITMHGVRVELLQQQATSIGLPLMKMALPESPAMEVYNQTMHNTLSSLKHQGIETILFGDIFLEDLRHYREEQVAQADMQAAFPLWKLPTRELIHEFIDLGFKTIVVCVNEKYLDRSFAGRIIDHSFLKDLPADVDPCGEYGEFHTFVFDGPLFKYPVMFDTGEVIYRKYFTSDNTSQLNTGFWFCDLIPKMHSKT